MGNINRFIERAKKWRFKVNGIQVPEPIGWDNIRLTLTRSEKYKSLFRGFSADMEYYFGGYDTITNLNETTGIQTDANLQVEKVDTNTGEYTEVLNSKLDFVEYTESSENRKGVRVPLVDNSFNEKLKSREDISVPLDRAKDLDDNPMNAIEYTDISLEGREFGGLFNAEIYQEPATESDPINEYYLYASAGATEALTLVTNFGEVASLLPNVNNVSKLSGNFPFDLIPSNCFYYTNLSSADIKVKINYDLEVEGFQTTWLRFSIITFNEAGEFVSETNLEQQTIKGIGSVTSGTFEHDLSLTKNQGLALWVYIASLALNDSTVKIKEGTNLEIDYISRFDPTPCKVILPFEAFSHLATAITGEANSFRSNYFGRTDIGYAEDGEGALVAITNGLLIRQFPTGYEQKEDADRVSQLALTFAELFNNHYKKDNIGIQVIKENGKYILIAEKQSELYNYNISHVADVIEKGSFKRTRNLDNYYSKIDAGYITAPDDLLGGLEEYISKIEHSTSLSFVQNTLDLVCTYSAISSRIEKQRRRPFAQTSTEELTGDNTIFFIELWRNVHGDLVQRSEQGFTDIIGLDGLDTKLNLGITPKQILLRHGNEINVGLAIYPNSKVKYNKSDKTTDLQLLYDGSITYIVENADVVAGNLDSPLWTGYNIEFNSVLGLSDYFNIQDNPNYLIEYTSPLTGQINYAWAIEIGTDAVDKENNMILKEANPPDVATRKALSTNNDNEGIATNNNELIEVI